MTQGKLTCFALAAALGLASVSAYFSIIGLTALFAAAVVPVAIMGAALECAKLIAAAWLHRNWRTAPRALCVALAGMVALLMAITSMGVFGFLARAHIEQQTTASIVIDGRAVSIGEQIAQRVQVIADIERRLAQIDSTVEQAANRGRSNTAVSLADRQRRERAVLVSDRNEQGAGLVSMRIEKATVDAQRKRQEAEIGPVRYLAQLIQGESADLEHAVRLMILALVVVFDPLAVLLLLAANSAPRRGRPIGRKSAGRVRTKTGRPVGRPRKNAEPLRVVAS